MEKEAREYLRSQLPVLAASNYYEEWDVVDDPKESTDTETLEAKLRNQLTPAYGLADLVLKLRDNPDLLPILFDSATLAVGNKAEIDRLLKAIEEQKMVSFPFQTCPKCLGQGIVSKPPWVPGDVHEWSCSATSFVCNVCQGAKIIPMIIVPVHARMKGK